MPNAFTLYPDWESVIEPMVEKDLMRRAVLVEIAAKTNLSLPGGGRLYTTQVRTRLPGVPRGTPGRLVFFGSRPPHRASAPFEPAASDLGALRASVTWRAEADDLGFFVKIGSALYYAAYVELGTRYMEERPWLRPALLAGGDL